MIFHRLFVSHRFGWVLLVVLLAGVLGQPDQASSKPGGEVIATVEGKPILRDDLNSADLAKARQEAYQIESRMLTEEVLKRLREKRPKEFPEPNLSITEAEIEAVYKRAKLKERGPLEAFEDRIREFIKAERTAAHDQALFAKAIQKGYVKSTLKPPPAFRYRLAAVERKASKGRFSAPIHVVEFSDFQ